MDNTLSKNIIHPITNTIIKNVTNKHLVMPSGPSNRLVDQKMLSNNGEDITNMDAKALFFSDEYFFTAIFNANSFDEKIVLMKNIILANYDKQTVGYLLQRLT